MKMNMLKRSVMADARMWFGSERITLDAGDPIIVMNHVVRNGYIKLQCMSLGGVVELSPADIAAEDWKPRTSPSPSPDEVKP